MSTCDSFGVCANNGVAASDAILAVVQEGEVMFCSGRNEVCGLLLLMETVGRGHVISRLLGSEAAQRSSSASEAESKFRFEARRNTYRLLALRGTSRRSHVILVKAPVFTLGCEGSRASECLEVVLL